MYLRKRIIGMMTKYNNTVPDETVNFNINRLTNQVWKLIPMFEKEEDWPRQLSTVTIEVAGLNEILYFSPSLLQALSKLEGLLVEKVDFQIYRKTIFEIISLLQGMKTNETK